ncbi:MAG: hypothetical protein Q4D55_07670 [Eubacteriales bacterium]|nr:hypothetical protein [Eubacteriales bacterium]
MKKKEELPDYTVADMDLEGMPWNTRRPWQILPGDPAKRRKKSHVEPSGEGNPFLMGEEEPLTGEERRGMVWMALKAALSIGAVFGLAGLLFILFCLYVWLR